MPRNSAGLVLFRRISNNAPEVPLGHMGGPLWRGREAGAWTIPKGVPEPGEDLLAAARRETREEFGYEVEGPFLALAPIRQAGGSWYTPGPPSAMPTPRACTATCSASNGRPAPAAGRTTPSSTASPGSA